MLDRKAAGLSTSGCPGLPTLACTPVRASVHSLQESPLISAVKRLGKSFGRGLGKGSGGGKKKKTWKEIGNNVRKRQEKGLEGARKGPGRGPEKGKDGSPDLWGIISRPGTVSPPSRRKGCCRGVPRRGPRHSRGGWSPGSPHRENTQQFETKKKKQ